MTFTGRDHMRVAVTVTAEGPDFAMVTIYKYDAPAQALTAVLDVNHLEALETACRAARLELEARAKSMPERP